MTVHKQAFRPHGVDQAFVGDILPRDKNLEQNILLTMYSRVHVNQMASFRPRNGGVRIVTPYPT